MFHIEVFPVYISGVVEHWDEMLFKHIIYIVHVPLFRGGQRRGFAGNSVSGRRKI